jgi:hypothetical protein
MVREKNECYVASQIRNAKSLTCKKSNEKKVASMYHHCISRNPETGIAATD